MTDLLYVIWLRSDGRDGVVSDEQSRRTASWARQALSASPHQAYRLIAAGDTTRRLGQQAHHVVPPFHSRLEDPEAPDTLVVARLESLDAARRCRRALSAAIEGGAPLDLVDAGAYSCLQEWDAGATDAGSWAPVVHFGTYDTHHPDDEWQLADYYADVRMPRFLEQEGALRAHRLAGACGAPGRTAVLYELGSVAARTRNFEPLEAQAEAARAQALTLHGALSPSIGVRIETEPMRRILVVGATGLVGRAAVEHFAARPGWSVTAVSRRPVSHRGVAHVTADLRDADGCTRALAAAGPFTHVLYAALYERTDVVAGWRDPGQMEINAQMLGNLLHAVEAVSPALERVIALQGGKAYGVHLGRVPVPAKERWPRGPHEIFYWAQEDLLARRSASAGWTYTLLRPQRILGDAVASPLSIVAALGVYAATWRERGRPLTFPGGGRYVNACTDSRLLARAIEHCAVTDSAANETFNVVNGDWVDWRDLWPRVAARFRMPVGPDEPLSLAEHMPAHEAAWRRLALRHGLRHRTMAEVAGPVWGYADLVLGAGDDHPHHNVMSPVKLLGTGFADGQDTEESIDYWLGRLQTSRVLPR